MDPYLRADDYCSRGLSFGLNCPNQQRNTGLFVLPTTTKVPSGEVAERFYWTCSTSKRQKRFFKEHLKKRDHIINIKKRFGIF